MPQNGWPRVLWFGIEHPESLLWVEEHGDKLLGGGSDLVGVAVEVDGVVVIDPALGS